MCTSSNAAATLTWAWARGEDPCSFRISISVATPPSGMGAARSDGGGGSERDRRWSLLRRQRTHHPVERALLVHVRFTVRQIEQLRAQHPAFASSCIPKCHGKWWRQTMPGPPAHIIGQVKSESARIGVGGGQRSAPGKSPRSRSHRPPGLPAPVRVSLDDVSRRRTICSVLEGLLAGEVHNETSSREAQKHWNRVAPRTDVVHPLRATPIPSQPRAICSISRKPYDHFSIQTGLRDRNRRNAAHGPYTATPALAFAASNRTSTRGRWRFITASITRHA